MSRDNLHSRYSRIIEEESSETPTPDGVPPDGIERRRHPRIEVKPGDLPVLLDPWVFAIDVSISGMAFYSEEEVEAGKVINITLGHMMYAEAEVVNCILEEPASPYHPARYRLNCRFLDENQGMELLVKIKDLESVEEPTP